MKVYQLIKTLENLEPDLDVFCYPESELLVRNY
jgi:hypothetical protein